MATPCFRLRKSANIGVEMGTFMPFSEDVPFEEKVKCLADEELLEIWAESQEVENMINMRMPTEFRLPPGYEQTIINELSLRLGKRLATGSHT